MLHAIVSERQRSRAKQLRPTMTRAETPLWRNLKANRRRGAGFRRQTLIGSYTADFVCLCAKLILELGGESREFAEPQKADRRREAFVVSQDFHVVHFPNAQVMSNLEGVV